jgi:hypothetical protein
MLEGGIQVLFERKATERTSKDTSHNSHDSLGHGFIGNSDGTPRNPSYRCGENGQDRHSAGPAFFLFVEAIGELVSAFCFANDFRTDTANL